MLQLRNLLKEINFSGLLKLKKTWGNMLQELNFYQ